MNKLKQRGFTLIEVVIVLAIGAVIILVVLQQVASAQRNQRNSTRRSEASRIVSLLENYASSHNGIYPTNAQAHAAINTQDQALGGKYLAANWIDDGYAAPTDADPSDDLGASVCGTLNASEYKIVYAPEDVRLRDYRLAGCLETASATAEMVVVK